MLNNQQTVVEKSGRKAHVKYYNINMLYAVTINKKNNKPINDDGRWLTKSC